MVFSAGTRLGSYEVTALIGQGGRGEDYKAQDIRLKRLGRRCGHPRKGEWNGR